jgi:tetratricopeptide (TPR) repeat protein
VLGKRQEARECFDRAYALFEALEARLDLAKLLVERAVLAFAEQRADDARRDLCRAHELYAACGVKPPLARIAQLTAASDPACDTSDAPSTDL